MAAAGSCTPPGSLDPSLPGFPKAILRAEVQGKYLCSECEDLLRRPFQAQCGHRYCAYCLKKLVGSGPLPCAACLREGLYEEGVSVLDSGTAFPDNAARREVESLPAACLRKDCPWKGTVKEYEAHEETCPKFPLTCDGCGKTDVPRESFADHVRSCGSFRAPCRFRPVGCGEVLEKEALPLHEAQNFPEHLGLLLDFALRLGAPDPHFFGGPDLVQDPQSVQEPHFFGAPHSAKDPPLAPDPHIFGAPDLVQEPRLAGAPNSAPHLARDPHLLGATPSAQDPHLVGAPHLGKDPHLAPHSLKEPPQVGAPHLAQDPHLVGAPNSTQDPHFPGARNSAKDPHSPPDPHVLGAPPSAPDPHPIRAPHSAPDPHLAKDPHFLGAPDPSQAPRLPPDPHPTRGHNSDPHFLGAPHSAPDPHPTRGPHLALDPRSAPDPHVLGAPHSAPDPHPIRGPHLAPDPHVLRAPHSAPDPHPTRGPHLAPDPHVLGAPHWAALELKASTLEKIVCVLNREVERLAAESAQERRREEERAEALTHKIRSLERNLALKETAMAEVESALRRAEEATYDGVLIWKVEEVGRKRQEAVAGRAPAVFSPAFYTGRYGYKMCLRLYLNGDGSGRNTHLSLFFVLMKGPNDALLKWPFNQKVTLMLLDQDHREHVIDAFRPDVTSSSFQRPIGALNVASGCPLFCPLSKMAARDSYVRDDTLFIKAIVDLTGL